jgi:hypothetical protein
MVPNATRTTAFLSGASLVALASGLDVLKSRGIIPYNADSPELGPYFLTYFFFTCIVFVIGLRNVFPRALRTRIPFVHFPTDREGWLFLLHCWGRMLAWFVGFAASLALSVAIRRMLP